MPQDITVDTLEGSEPTLFLKKMDMLMKLDPWSISAMERMVESAIGEVVLLVGQESEKDFFLQRYDIPVVSLSDDELDLDGKKAIITQTAISALARGLKSLVSRMHHGREIEDGTIFSDVVKNHRVELSMSQEELASKVDVSQPFISAIERGSVLSIDAVTLYRLACALSLSPLYLLRLAAYNREMNEEEMNEEEMNSDEHRG